MPHVLKSLTPSLIVSNVERSVAFYRDTLGFEVNTTVPEQTPYVFVLLKLRAR
jgi:catechol 2,3-dioxygenase-like lactoylglutathione lyase family enzyme